MLLCTTTKMQNLGKLELQFLGIAAILHECISIILVILENSKVITYNHIYVLKNDHITNLKVKNINSKV